MLDILLITCLLALVLGGKTVTRTRNPREILAKS